MSMNIKSAEAHRLARELAEREGITVTEAVTRALREALDARAAADASLLAELDAISERIRAKLPPGMTSENATDDLYDEFGLPR